MDGMTIREMVDHLTTRVGEIEKRLSTLESRVSMMMGGIGVIGVTAIVNAVTNVMQAGS